MRYGEKQEAPTVSAVQGGRNSVSLGVSPGGQPRVKGQPRGSAEGSLFGGNWEVAKLKGYLSALMD